MQRCVCFAVPGPNGPVGGGADLTLPTLLMGWAVLALLLFLLRPSSLRGSRSTGKPTGPHNVSAGPTSRWCHKHGFSVFHHDKKKNLFTGILLHRIETFHQETIKLQKKEEMLLVTFILRHTSYLTLLKFTASFLKIEEKMLSEA